MINFNKKSLFGWNTRKIEQVILFALVLYVLLKEYNIVFNIFQYLEDLFYNLNFWSALGAFGSFVVAIAVAYMTYIYNKKTNIQNKLAFEEFRPVLKVKKEESRRTPVIINEGKFEASEIVYIYKYYDYKNKKMGEVCKKDDYESFLLSPGAEKELARNIKAYYSYVIFYKNYSSGILYVNGFNFRTGKKRIYSIGDSYKDVEGNITKSPIKKEKYLKLLNKIKLEKQVTKKININGIVEDFFNEIL